MQVILWLPLRPGAELFLCSFAPHTSKGWQVGSGVQHYLWAPLGRAECILGKKKKKGKSLPSSNAWPTSSPLSLKAPFVLVYPPAVWVHHVVSTVLGRGRALTMAPLPSSFISQLGILSQVHSSWPLSPLPVRQGWWWLPWLLSALSGFLGGFKQLKAVEAFYEV